MSDFCVATSVILFVFCQTALFRVAPTLTLVFVVITLHQCFSSWIGGVRDLNDSQVNDTNDSRVNDSNDDLVNDSNDSAPEN